MRTGLPDKAPRYSADTSNASLFPRRFPLLLLPLRNKCRFLALTSRHYPCSFAILLLAILFALRWSQIHQAPIRVSSNTGSIHNPWSLGGLPGRWLPNGLHQDTSPPGAARSRKRVPSGHRVSHGSGDRQGGVGPASWRSVRFSAPDQL